MTKPDHDAIDAALSGAFSPVHRAMIREALSRHGLAIVPAGESAAGAARDMREAHNVAVLQRFQGMKANYTDIPSVDTNNPNNTSGALPAPQPDQREAAMRSVCDDIQEIMAEYRRQDAKGYIDTPGGFEHLDDVWNQMSRWDAALTSALSPSKPQEPPHD